MICLTLFLEFFKIGLFCFGGGFGMVPLIREAVLKHGWLSENAFYNFVGVCESTPGPIAVNMATYIGSVQGGILGSLSATAGVILPSFLIILLVAAVLRGLTENRYFKGFLRGVKPVIIALILSTGTVLLAKAVGYVSLRVFAADFVSITVFALLTATYFVTKAVFKRRIPTALLILLSALLGIGVSMLHEAVVL